MSAPYSADNPRALADEIDRVLELYGRGSDKRMMPSTAVSFYEGELKTISKALRLFAEYYRNVLKPVE